MQDLLVIFFPLLIDGLNAVGGLDNPRYKFWVSLVTSFIGGVMLNLPAVNAVILHPTADNVVTLLTVLALIVSATQGLYVKFWENHPVRQAMFPSVTNAQPKVEVVPEPESPVAQ